ncbi:MAG: M14 family zinc carboxypeptidase [Candidatus Bipolaricaulaceae bacterium]
MNSESVLADVPDFQRFLTVDELNASTETLAGKHPDRLRVVTVGQSTAGEPIRMLRIGRGEEQLLLFACPHPNEPIGAMTLEYLARRLVEDDQLRGKEFTWNIIKCIDPDGIRLNEGWFKGPFTVTNYARHFYRPAGFRQAEWTFPIVYKELAYFSPTPETQALMTAIAGVRPRFLYSLHNAGFGGGYYYLWPDRPAIYDRLRGLMTARGVPLALGEPEMPWAESLSPAVYRIPTVRDHYDFLEKYTDGSPAEGISAGASSFEFARAISDPAMLVCELPYFYDPRIEDAGEAGMSRKEAILAGVESSRKMTSFLKSQLKGVEERLTEQSPFRTAVQSFLQVIAAGDAAKERWANTNPALEAPATVAQAFDNLLVGRFYRLLTCGMLVRALELELAHRQVPQVAEAKAAVVSRFEAEAGELERALDYRVIPIKSLVEIQLGAALAVLAHL